MAIYIPKIVVVRQMIDKVGACTTRHRHNYVQAGYVKSGVLTITLDSKRSFNVHSDEFFSIAQRQEHIISTLGNQQVNSIDLRFRAVTCGTDDFDIQVPGCKELRWWTNHSFKIEKKYAKNIQKILEKMMQVPDVSNEIQNFILSVYLLNLSETIAPLPSKNKYKLKTDSYEHKAVISAIDIIYRNYHQPLTISAISKQIGISVWHLSKLFRRYTGYTPKQFLIRHRINVAKKMIMQEQFQLKEIAYKTGFSSLQQFSRIFKHIEGYPPSHLIN